MFEFLMENVDTSRIPAVALIMVALLAVVYVITRQPHHPDTSPKPERTGAKSNTVQSTPLSDSLIKAIDDALAARK